MLLNENFLTVSSEKESSAVHLSTTSVVIQLELFIDLRSVEVLESGVKTLFSLKKLFFIFLLKDITGPLMNSFIVNLAIQLISRSAGNVIWVANVF
jgi:hypothetical protein